MRFLRSLREVGILHDTPESAAAVLNAVGGGVREWWRGRELQAARKAFRGEFALTSTTWVGQWKALFESLASEVKATS